MFITRPKESISLPEKDRKLELFCGATGNPIPKIFWFRNGVQLEIVDASDIDAVFL